MMKEFENVLAAVAWTGIFVLAALLLIRVWYVWRTRHQRKNVADAPAIVVTLRVAGAVGLALVGYGLIAYLYVLLRGSTFMPAGLKLVLAGLLILYLGFEVAAYLKPRLPVSRILLSRGFAGAIASAAIGALLVTAYWNASQYPPLEAGVVLDPPFEGEWVAIGAGATGRTNHHNRIPSQRFAIDIAKACSDGRLFRGQGNAFDESCTFGAAVLSPVAGVIAHVVDGLSDLDSKRELAGNHVIIRMADHRYVALAHLQQGSITVKAGDSVETGQKIGHAGNSGNSDFPHLHIHVQDGPQYDLRESGSIPFRFRNAEVKRFLFWRPVSAAVLLSNDRIRSRENRSPATVP
jgi:hypothetical protein